MGKVIKKDGPITVTTDTFAIDGDYNQNVVGQRLNNRMVDAGYCEHRENMRKRVTDRVMVTVPELPWKKKR